MKKGVSPMAWLKVFLLAHKIGFEWSIHLLPYFPSSYSFWIQFLKDIYVCLLDPPIALVKWRGEV
jgi:hypothetical protein